MTGPQAAVVLAGGRGSRLGGADKPALRVAGRTLLEIALDAVGNCPVVVVGPTRALPAGMTSVREEPPGGGPAAAVVAGIRALPTLPPDAVVALLAADLPGITADGIGRLCAAMTPPVVDADRQTASTSMVPKADSVGGAILVDPTGRRQYLTGVWRISALLAAAEQRSDWTGIALRELLAPITTIDIAGSDRETADVDTPADWRRWQS